MGSFLIATLFVNRSFTLILNHNVLDKNSLKLKEYLQSKVIGQEEAIEQITLSTQKFFAGLKEKDRPISTLLLIGPEGTGKNKLVTEFFNFITAGKKSVRPVKINCGESKVTIEIDTSFTPKNDNDELINIVIFDSVEKSSHDMLNVIQNALERAEIKLSNEMVIDLTECFLFLIYDTQYDNSSSIGFVPSKPSVDFFEEMKFESAFIDKVINFKKLTKDNYYSILRLELLSLQERLLHNQKKKILIHVTKEAEEKIIISSCNEKIGVKNLRQFIENTIVSSLSNILLSDEVKTGDIVSISINNDKFEFEKIEFLSKTEIIKVNIKI